MFASPCGRARYITYCEEAGGDSGGDGCMSIEKSGGAGWQREEEFSLYGGLVAAITGSSGTRNGCSVQYRVSEQVSSEG